MTSMFYQCSDALSEHFILKVTLSYRQRIDHPLVIRKIQARSIVVSPGTPCATKYFKVRGVNRCPGMPEMFPATNETSGGRDHPLRRVKRRSRLATNRCFAMQEVKNLRTVSTEIRLSLVALIVREVIIEMLQRRFCVLGNDDAIARALLYGEKGFFNEGDDVEFYANLTYQAQLHEYDHTHGRD
ncbi:hypothetical protein ARMGADRAFT_1038733 [Armillaria gallica]|uniref:Uncharacterized protein n=1 Tax=Armillaria gallica TaxID=47427 RepID=A0A2H3D1T4_ARMGA|nr:hypothetical protein ARMGADRAFT_1038733 [Armillaria gallica]